MKKVLVFIAFTTMFTACKQKGWSSADKQKFSKQCSPTGEDASQTDKKVCNCILEKIEKKYANFDEFTAKSTEAEAVELGAACGMQAALNGSK